MSITAKDVSKLRQTTGAGMMDCKKALVEADGDFEKAVDILRAKGQKVSAKRADRETSEGSVFVKTNSEETIGYLVALNCETDFVAKNDDFVNLGQSILNIASSKEIEEKAALESENMEDGRSISEHITEMIGKIGEKIEISSYEKIKGEAVVPYVHSNSKLGVLVSLNGASGDEVKATGRDLAMQIAAMNPVALDKSDVSQDVIDRELAVGKEQAIEEGKPADLAEKIAQGRLNKFFKEATLLNQQFVKDNSKTIKDVLKDVDSNLTVATFKRVSI